MLRILGDIFWRLGNRAKIPAHMQAHLLETGMIWFSAHLADLICFGTVTRIRGQRQTIKNNYSILYIIYLV